MKVKSIWVNNNEIILDNGLICIAEVAPECYERITSPKLVIAELKKKQVADILVFGQRLPDTTPRYNYYIEWENIAVIPITNFNEWREKQITKEVRKNIIKATKKGVMIKVVEFNDDFVKGVSNIYNESAFRQGKPFWHYNKDFDTVKKELATYLERCEFIGAYYNDELIGFIKMFYSDQCASTMHIISKIEHRDKKPTNALIAKAVEICSQKAIPLLQYGLWTEESLGDFKRYNGFQKISIPMYYVPLTMIGSIALKCGAHKGWKQMLPESIKKPLKRLRRIRNGLSKE